MFGALKRGFKNVAAGRTQASLGLQSPHTPGAVVRIGRFLYCSSLGWIGVCWYTGFVNKHTQQGGGPQLILPGSRNLPNVGGPDRPGRTPKFVSSGLGTQAPGGALGQSTKALPGSSIAGGFLPRGATYKPGRADQGRDGQTNPGGPIIAPGSGTVLHVLSDPNGFGPNYPVVKFNSGPFAGRIIYIGHTHSALAVGARFRSGEVLSYTGKSGVGNATVPGWFEIGFADSGYPGPMGQPTPF